MPEDIIINTIVKKMIKDLDISKGRVPPIKKIKSNVEVQRSEEVTVDYIVSHVLSFFNEKPPTQVEREVLEYIAEKVVSFYSPPVGSRILKFVLGTSLYFIFNSTVALPTVKKLIFREALHFVTILKREYA